MARLFHSDSIVSERDLTSGTNHRSPFSSKVARNSHGRERLERVPTSIFRFRKMILSTISDVQNGEKEIEGGKSPGKRVPRGRATRASEIRTGNTGHPTDILHNSIYVSRGATSDPRDRRRGGPP